MSDQEPSGCAPGTPDPPVPAAEAPPAEPVPEPAAAEAAPTDPAEVPAAAPAKDGAEPSPPGERGGEAADVAEGLTRLEEALAAGFAAAARRDRILDDLHRENQAHRRDLLLGAMEPLIRGLIRLHDDMADTLQRAESEPDRMDREKLRADLAIYAEEVLALLARQGVEPYDEEPGAVFDPRRHRISQTAPVAEPADDARVLEVLRQGFALHRIGAPGGEHRPEGEKILRPLSVIVGKYRTPPSAETGSAAAATDNPETLGGDNRGS